MITDAEAWKMVEDSTQRWHTELGDLIAANGVLHAADGRCTPQADLLGLYVALNGLRRVTAKQLERDGLSSKALEGLASMVLP